LLGVPEEGRRGNNVVALRPSAKRTRPETRKRRAPVGAASRKRN